MKPQRKTSPAVDHRRQMIWQVWVPLGASILIVLGLAGLAVAGAFMNSKQVERWGNLSAVWVILPVLFAGFIFLAIVFACVYGMSKLLERTSGWMLKLQLGIEQISKMIRLGADTSTRPVMAVHEVQAQIATAWKKVFGKSG